MDMTNLQTHNRTLAMLPATGDPVVSCCVALESGRIKEPFLFDAQIQAILPGRTGGARWTVEDALRPIRAFLSNALSPGSKGAAVLSRAGKEPFLLMFQCRVPLPNWTAVGKTPNICHLAHEHRRERVSAPEPAAT